MIIYKNANDSLRVGAYENEGKFYIVIEKKVKRLVATRGSRKAHVEEFIDSYEKEFTDKGQANRYFIGIKKKNPTLAKI